MSNDESPNVPASRDRREAVREKAQQVQAKHARARTFRLVALGVLAIVVVAAVVTGVVAAVTSSASTSTAAPRNVTADGGIPISSVEGVALSTGSLSDPSAAPSGPAEPTPTATSASTVDIRIYVDYLASGAKEFELANATQLSKWFTAGSANVTYYPVAMLTAKSNGTKYSLRAASAAACVATYSPETVYAFSHELLAKQPDMDSAGIADTDLASLAIAKGASSPKSVRSCIEDEDYVTWAKSMTDAALTEIPDTDGLTLTGTPLVLVNGEMYQGSLDNAKEFAQFVLTTASASYYDGTATPTPTPTPSE
jgi:protein-disulfide isomerase